VDKAALHAFVTVAETRSFFEVPLRLHRNTFHVISGNLQPDLVVLGEWNSHPNGIVVQSIMGLLESP